MNILHTIFTLIATFSLTFALKESVLFDRPRSWLIRLHPFFFWLFECYHCVGFWSSLVIYLLANSHYDIKEALIWGLGGAGISLLMSLVVSKLNE